MLLLLAPPQSLSLDSVLTEVRRAVHYEAFQRLPDGIYMRGETSSSGGTGSYMLLQRPDGLFSVRVSIPNLGKFPTVGAFDGRNFWSSDRTGATTIGDPASGGERALAADFQTHGWLNPVRKYKISLGPITDDEISLRLVTKEGFSTATLRIDSTSWLPEAMTVHNYAGPRKINLSDYRLAAGVMLPHKIIDDRGGIADTLTIGSVEAAPTSSPSECVMPDWKPTDTTFEKTDNRGLRCIRGPGGQLMVWANLAGRDGWYILDSGASVMLVDTKLADELNLAKVGELSLLGIGGTVKMHYRPVPTFRLGSMTIKHLIFSEYDLSSLGDAFGVKVSGIVGFDVFRRSVIEIEFASNRAALHDPATYKLPKGGSWQYLGFASRSPYIEASFLDHKGRFRLDTGASTAVIFKTPTVRQYKLTAGQRLLDTGLGGVGGNTPAVQGTIGSFTLGRKTFKNLPATFATATTGLVADPFLAGNIGTPLMEPFRVVLDFGGNRMAFVPK